MSQALYDQDFYLWTRDQAAVLRARAGGADGLDYDRLAEEVEDLGSAEKNKVRSAVRLILEHLFKLHGTRNAQPVGHWKGEIENFRADMDDTITPTIRRLVQEDLEALHRRAGKTAVLRFKSDEPDAVIDTSLRWTWDQITGDADDPLERDYPLIRE